MYQKMILTRLDIFSLTMGGFIMIKYPQFNKLTIPAIMGNILVKKLALIKFINNKWLIKPVLDIIIPIGFYYSSYFCHELYSNLSGISNFPSLYFWVIGNSLKFNIYLY